MLRKKKAATGTRASWLNSYADMVTLLLCFFVLMFAMSSVDEDRFTALAEAFAGRTLFMSGALGTVFTDDAGMFPDHAPPIPIAAVPDYIDYDIADDILDVVTGRIGELEGMADAFLTYMAQYEALELIGIRVDELGEYMAITFPSGMLFDSGQAILRPEAVQMIDYVAVRLADFPGHRIAVHGHTDDVPINTLPFPSNFHLSAARSIAVIERLQSYHDFDPWMLEAVGLGEFRPIDTNTTAEGRANNRRVEILVFAQQQGLTVITD